jgi:hypothetical protein
MTLTLEIKRQGLRNFINYFLGFFVAVLLSAFMCLIHADRFSFILAAVFALIGNKYVLDQLVPATANFTLSDNLQIASFTFVIVAALLAALDSRTSPTGGRKPFQYLSPTVTGIGLALYTFYVVANGAIAFNS